MKIYFSTIPMQKVNPLVYRSVENKAIEYNEPVRFPGNALMAKALRKGDKVKVVRIITEGKFSDENVGLQKEELDRINSTIGAEIEYVDIREQFREDSATTQSRFRQLIGTLEEECDVYADMTYGPKTLTPVLFYALGFAERFFDADIRNIIYGKATFGADKMPIPEETEIFDVTSLYYLNSLTNVMDAPDGKTALERLDRFFKL